MPESWGLRLLAETGNGFAETARQTCSNGDHCRVEVDYDGNETAK